MKKRSIKILAAILVPILLLAGTFFIYVSDDYRADSGALAVLENNPAIERRGSLLILPPAGPSETALIFYPGAKVEAAAYLPILEKISQRCGITSILVEMPFNMAIFDADAADPIFGQFPDISKWYVGGHSMGGAMASDYASKHPDKVKGLILLGAYLYGDYPADRALTLYGSFNTSVAAKVDYTENVVVIEGGNHAQFGNYGPQRGDPAATISGEAQQDIAVEAIRAFLAK